MCRSISKVFLSTLSSPMLLCLFIVSISLSIICYIYLSILLDIAYNGKTSPLTVKQLFKDLFFFIHFLGIGLHETFQILLSCYSFDCYIICLLLFQYSLKIFYILLVHVVDVFSEFIVMLTFSNSITVTLLDCCYCFIIVIYLLVLH